MKLQVLAAIAFVFVLLPRSANAQVVVGTGVAAYEPQVSTLTTGVLHDVQATVSADRKYVTMTARPSLSTLTGFFTFSFNGPTTQNTVGSGTGTGTGGGGGGNHPGVARNPNLPQLPEVRRAPTVLDHAGMTFISAS